MKLRMAVVLAAAGCLLFVATALATNIAAVRYDPPRITLVDQPELASQEDVVVSKQGHEYSFAQPSGLVKHLGSKPGCTDNFSTDYRCPVRGVKTIVCQTG